MEKLITCSVARALQGLNRRIMKVVLSKDGYSYKFSVEGKMFRVEVFKDDKKVGEWYTTKPSSHIPVLVEHVFRSSLSKEFPTEWPLMLYGYFNMTMFHKLED